jgi:hypothetical protein
MITSLQQLTTLPALVQNDVSELSDSVLSRVVKTYEEERKKNPKEELKRLQAHYEINPSSGVGRSYGQYPPWAKYQGALDATRDESRIISTSPCDGCGQPPAESRCLPCRHLLCRMCAEEVEATIGDHVFSGCRECDAEVLRIEKLDHQQLTPSIQPRKKKRGKAGAGEHWWPKLGGLPMPSHKGMVVKLKLLEWLHEDPTVKIVAFAQYLGV